MAHMPATGRNVGEGVGRPLRNIGPVIVTWDENGHVKDGHRDLANITRRPPGSNARLRPCNDQREGRVRVPASSGLAEQAATSKKVAGNRASPRPDGTGTGTTSWRDRVTVTVFAFDVAGDRIKHIWAVRNPGLLWPWTAG
jgi:hypothetical protein